MSLSSFFRVVFLGAFSAAGVLHGQDLTISSGSTTGITNSTSGGTVTYTASSTGSPVLNVNSIINELNAGKNVKVVGLRSITISSSINVSPSSAVTFTLESQGTTTNAAIVFGSGLQLKTTGAAVSIAIMMKTVDFGYSAYADLSNLDVNTGGGAFTVQGLESYVANAALSLDGATINAGAGNITMTALSYYTSTEATIYGVRIAGASNITTTTGNISITGNMLGAAINTTASSRPLLVEGTSTIRSTGSGSVTLKGEVPDINSPSVDPTYILELSTTGTISSGGTMTITGNNFGSISSVVGVAIRNAITSVGNLVINSTDIYVAEDITTTGSGSSIVINSKNNFSTDNASRQTISTNNGNISVIADDNADGSGVLDLDYLILAPGTGNIIIRGSTFTWTIALPTDKPYLNGTGSITIESSSASFGVDFSTNWFVFDQDVNGMSGLTIGKSTNTANIAHSGSAISVAGPVIVYGGNITINQDLASSTSGADILLRASGDIVLNTGRTITTNAGDVILWANSDGGTSNGGVFLDAASSITTSGGHVWIGGSSTNNGSSTWNGLTVGNGYAVSGRDLTPFQNEGTAIDWDAGVLLDETTINSGGGNIYIAGRRNAAPTSRSGAGIINYSGTSGTLINSGTGTITMLGETSADLAFSDFGIMTGLHPANYTGRLTIQSANTSSVTAISITASTVTAEAGLLVEGHARILSTAASGGGGISMALSSGTGSALQVGIGGNSGTLDMLSASGAIAVDGGSDAITVPAVGTFKIGSISGDANVPSSTANVTLTSNTISLAGSAPIVTTGSLTIRPTTGNSFTSTFSTSVLNYTGITGLTIGHTANTAAVTVASTISIAGPITIYGGDIAINQNLTSTASGEAILLRASGNILVAASRTIVTNGSNITLWTDADNNNLGGIRIDDNVTVDSRTIADRSNNAHTSGGGRITFAGGLDDGGSASGTGSISSGLVSNDGFPDGYAVNSGSSATQTGIVLGTSSNSTGHNCNVSIFSGGGHIRLHGLTTNNSSNTVSGPTGLLFFEGYNINSGTNGNITLIGNANLTSGSWASGMDLAAWRTTTGSYTANATVRTVNGNINIIGRAAGGTSGNFAILIDGGTNRHIFATTGSGSLNFDGLATGTSPLDIRLTNVDALSSSGSIALTSRSSSGIHIGGTNFGDGLFLGQKSNSLVTNSSSNISIIANNIQLTRPLNTNSTGALVFESLSNSFSSNISLSNQTIASTHTSLRIGKTTNTTNVTTGGSSISIAGPISIFGGTITINENIASSNGSAISLFGNGLTFGSGKTVSSSGQLIVAPQTASNSIGLGGATGNLSLPASYFSTNFSDGFSNIQIGSNTQTGAIAANTFTLRDNMTFLTSGSLTLGGRLELGSNNVTLGSGITTINVGSPANYFQTNGTGTLIRNIASGTNRLFPIGNSAYNPVTITNNTGAADEFSMRVMDEVYENGATGTVLTTPRVRRTWLIDKTTANAGSGIDFVFNWNAGESTANLNSPRLYHYDGTEWDKQTGTTSSTSNSLTYNGYTGTFSPFAIGDDVVMLPVSWLNFGCQKTNDARVNLNWSTASEENSKRFVVERSDNGQAFVPIGEVPAAGLSHSIQQYSFTDANPLKTAAYYRIAMEEFNGHLVYTSTCMSNASAADENKPVKVYPNPSKGTVNIHATDGGTYTITDMAGRILRSGELQPNTRIEGLPQGIYCLMVQSGDVWYTQKLVVE